MVLENRFHIRPAKKADKKIIADIYRLCFDSFRAEVSVDELLYVSGCWGLIAEKAVGRGKETRAGGFLLARSVLDEAEILSLAVRPDFQRQGMARRLMQQAIEEARKRQGKKMFLEVAADNFSARILYQRLDFREIGRRKNYYLKADRRRVDALNLGLGLEKST